MSSNRSCIAPYAAPYQMTQTTLVVAMEDVPMNGKNAYQSQTTRRWIDRFRSRAFWCGMWLGLIFYLIFITLK